ncbi:hypothetical protein KIL84_006501 [Mauremys mutica]|uniref:SERTA domain-containing protein n=1 Tax=Mauremys mutica TaxID=74926 RepID=A0A9D3X1K2_9SAUR|nr:hypothetical protein KIL84_006501 [Mauremys mutica]
MLRASSPPSNSLSNGPTSAPSGPIRERNIWAARPLLWSEPGMRSAVTGGSCRSWGCRRGQAEEQEPSAGASPSLWPRLAADPIRVLTNTLTTSKVAYFKRKYAEEEDLHQDYQGYFPKHLILPEDRTCILKLSLQKLRFLEDPETYLRRSVLINNLLRKIHLETDRESYEYFKEAPCYRTAYSDTRKRLKFMVQECCSQSLYYEELHSYHIVPYSTENSIYGMGYTSGHLEKNSQLLIYKMN